MSMHRNLYILLQGHIQRIRDDAHKKYAGASVQFDDVMMKRTA